MNCLFMIFRSIYATKSITQPTKSLRKILFGIIKTTPIGVVIVESMIHLPVHRLYSEAERIRLKKFFIDSLSMTIAK